MNIMLVSVTERTREIGLKKALGARKRRILTQFLTEAAVLTLLGGLIGVAGGIALAYIISAVSAVPVAISGVSILVGRSIFHIDRNYFRTPSVGEGGEHESNRCTEK